MYLATTTIPLAQPAEALGICIGSVRKGPGVGAGAWRDMGRGRGEDENASMGSE